MVKVVAVNAAKQSGIKTGGAVIKVGDRDVSLIREIGDAMRAVSPEVPITLIRESMTIEVEISFAPPAIGRPNEARGVEPG